MRCKNFISEVYFAARARERWTRDYAIDAHVRTILRLRRLKRALFFTTERLIMGTAAANEIFLVKRSNQYLATVRCTARYTARID